MIDAWSYLTAQDRQALCQILEAFGHGNVHEAKLALMTIETVSNIFKGLFHSKDYWNTYGTHQHLMVGNKVLAMDSDRAYYLARMLKQAELEHAKTPEANYVVSVGTTDPTRAS